MKKFHSLSTHLVLVILLPLAVLLFAAAWFEFRFERNFLLDTAETAAVNLSDGVTEELQGILRSTRASTNGLAIALEQQGEQDRAAIEAILRATLEDFPLVFGTTLAFDPQFEGVRQPLAPYAFRQGETVVIDSLAGDDYRYWEWPWFTEPLSSGEATWTDPYLDEGGGDVRMVTYSRPLEISGRRAVLTADISLSFLSTIANSEVLGRAGAVMVFDRNGRLVAHPQEALIFNQTLDQLAEQESVAALVNVPELIAHGESVWLRPDDGMHAGVVGGDPALPGRLYARPLKEAGWGVAVYFSDQAFLQTAHNARALKLLFTAVLLALVSVLITWASRRSLRPLGELALRARTVAQGKFDADTPGQERQDEVGRLSRAFHTMQEKLKAYIDDLTRATAERERMAAELSAARQIQAMQLPAENPSDSALHMHLVARLQPAREVGGDLYYYQLMPNQRLVFAVGDVSDKGIPAALYMARAMTLIKLAVQKGLTPGKMLAAVNRVLSEDNDMCMFVTLLVGEIELESGRCHMASAGHENPIRVSRSGAHSLDIATGPPVGLDALASYEESALQLDQQECLFVYTDGVTDARNNEGTLFGEERMYAVLSAHGGDGPDIVTREIVHEVDVFMGEAERADDMTLMVLQWHPQEHDSAQNLVSGQLEYPVRQGAHREVLEALQQAASDAGLDGLEPPDLALMCEEVVVNVVSHSGLGAEDNGRVTWRMNRTFMEIRFEDSGVAFNPLECEEPDAEEHDFDQGGMGIMLIKALVDNALYERREGRNILTLIRGIDPAGEDQENQEHA